MKAGTVEGFWRWHFECSKSTPIAGPKPGRFLP